MGAGPEAKCISRKAHFVRSQLIELRACAAFIHRTWAPKAWAWAQARPHHRLGNINRRQQGKAHIEHGKRVRYYS